MKSYRPTYRNAYGMIYSRYTPYEHQVVTRRWWAWLLK